MSAADGRYATGRRGPVGAVEIERPPRSGHRSWPDGAARFGGDAVAQTRTHYAGGRQGAGDFEIARCS